jgi:hypothetical protein
MAEVTVNHDDIQQQEQHQHRNDNTMPAHDDHHLAAVSNRELHSSSQSVTDTHDMKHQYNDGTSVRHSHDDDTMKYDTVNSNDMLQQQVAYVEHRVENHEIAVYEQQQHSSHLQAEPQQQQHEEQATAVVHKAGIQLEQQQQQQQHIDAAQSIQHQKLVATEQEVKLQLEAEHTAHDQAQAQQRIAIDHVAEDKQHQRDEQQHNINADQLHANNQNEVAHNPITTLSQQQPVEIQAQAVPSITAPSLSPASIAEDDLCELCDEAAATIFCGDCDMQFCTSNGCDDSMHKPAKMTTHRRIKRE